MTAEEQELVEDDPNNCPPLELHLRNDGGGDYGNGGTSGPKLLWPKKSKQFNVGK